MNKLRLFILIVGVITLLTPLELLAKKDIIAHRGASGYLPEHTLPNKAMAFAQNPSYIEQDVVLTKDNIPVVLHDITLDTVTNVAEVFPNRKRKDGRYYAIDFTLAEIKSLKASERFDPKTKKAVYPKRFPVKYDIFTVPTLEEELQLIAGLNQSAGKNIGIYPEIKSPAWHRQQGKDISKIVINTLAKYGYKSKKDNFYLQVFDFNELKRIKTELGFKGKLVMLLAENDWNEAPNNDYNYFKTEKGIKEIAKYATGLGPWIPQIIAGVKNGQPQLTNLVELAHKYKLVVHPYTARSDDLPKGIKSYNDLLKYLFIDAKVDGLFTDFPDKGVAFLQENNL